MMGQRINIPLVTKLYRKYRLARLIKKPAEICIETTSRCNVDCIMCPRKKMRRPQQSMDFDLFKKIIDECVDIGVGCVKPHNYGEPLLTQSFDKYLSYIRYKSKQIKILLVTNGTLLNNKMIDVILEEKVDEIVISIDGATRSTYEHIRRGADYKRVVANVLSLIRRKHERQANLPKVVVSMVKINQPEAEIKAFRKQWDAVADQIVINEYSTRGGVLGSLEDGFRKKRIPCFRLWKQAVVCSNGKVALCCSDWDCRIELGDLNQHSLQTIWQNSKLEKIRNMHLGGKAHQIAICSQCDPETWDPMPRWWF